MKCSLGWNDPDIAAHWARVLTEWSTWKWPLIVGLIALLAGLAPKILGPKYSQRADYLLQRTPRTISPQQELALHQYFAAPELAELKKTMFVDVDYVHGDHEIQAFANQLVAALKMAGLQAEAHPGTDPSVRGLRIAVKSETEMPQPARVLHRALQHAHIRSGFQYNPNFEPANLAWEVRLGARERYKDLVE